MKSIILVPAVLLCGSVWAQQPLVGDSAARWEARTGWVKEAPATDFGATAEGDAMVFSVRGTGKQMRWPLKLPEPVDLAAHPYFALRYRASVELGPKGVGCVAQRRG